MSGRKVEAQGLGGVTCSHLTPESPVEYQRRASLACGLILSAESSPQASRVRGGVAISVRADSRMLSFSATGLLFQASNNVWIFDSSLTLGGEEGMVGC